MKHDGTYLYTDGTDAQKVSFQLTAASDGNYQLQYNGNYVYPGADNTVSHDGTNSSATNTLEAADSGRT